MTSNPENSAALNSDLDALLNRVFPGKIVRKDLTKLVKEGANVPVFVLEYLLGNYCASQDPEVVDDGLQTVKRILAENFVRPDEAEKIKSSIREKGTYKVIDKMSVHLNEKTDNGVVCVSNKNCITLWRWENGAFSDLCSILVGSKDL